MVITTAVAKTIYKIEEYWINILITNITIFIEKLIYILADLCYITYKKYIL